MQKDMFADHPFRGSRGRVKKLNIPLVMKSDGDDIGEQEKAKLAENMKDRWWRLNNLYYIITEEGRKVRFQPNWAQKVLLMGLWYFNIILKARQLGFCLDPSTKVLTADLRWVRIDELKVGQEIISVDEHPLGGRGRGRKMKTGVVEGVVKVHRQSYRITFDDGRSVVCTGKHPWLSKKVATDTKWRTIDPDENGDTRRALKVGTHVRYITETWDEELSYEDGWFGGMLDGEGSLNKNSGTSISVAQVEGPALDRLRQYLIDNGYHFREYVDNRKSGEGSKLGNKPVHSLEIGRANEIFRLIGTTRPSRFLKMQWWKDQELPGKRTSLGWVTITSIEKLGKQTLIDLQTSEKTYIAEGLVSHNTTFLCILFLDTCLFRENTHCGIIAHNQEDAADFFEKKVKFAYDNLPDQIRESLSAPADSAKMLAFSNGSSIRVGTSLRSGTYYMLHISEFGKVCARYPGKAQEIVTGGINTVHAGQYIFIESTAEGRQGYFFDFCQAARKRAQMGKAPNKLQFKFFFFPWWRDPRYILEDETLITPDMEKYFDTLEGLGIKLTNKQKWWYVSKEEIQKDDMKREYPSTPEEAFEASIQGSYFGPQMTQVRKEGRIDVVPYDPLYPVNVFWDIGFNDKMSLWFHQRLGSMNHFIKYFEGSGEGLKYYVDYIKATGYTIGAHYMPHDSKAGSAQTGMNFREYANMLGLYGIVQVPRALNQEEVHKGIQEVRNMLQTSRFDEKECDLGIKCLDNYRKEWDANLGEFKKKPLHDWASNGSDSMRTGAVGYKPHIFIDSSNLEPEHANDL